MTEDDDDPKPICWANVEPPKDGNVWESMLGREFIEYSEAKQLLDTLKSIDSPDEKKKLVELWIEEHSK